MNAEPVVEGTPALPLPPPEPDLAEIRRFFEVFLSAGGVIELRSFEALELLQFRMAQDQFPSWRQKSVSPTYQRRGATTGYFSDREHAARAASSLNQIGGSSVYATLQSILPDLLARGKNTLAFKGKATEDGDIEAYRFLGLDLDPVRPSGIMANESERASAWEVGDRIREYLLDQGFPAPLRLDSGSGLWLIYPLEPLPASERALVENAIQSISKIFSTPQCEIDTGIANPARVFPVAGTVKMKGQHTPELGRPWRIVRMIDVPDDFGSTRVSHEQLRGLCGLAADTNPVTESLVTTGQSTVSPGPDRWFQWIEKHNVPIGKKTERAYGTVFQIDCLESPENHKGKAFLTILPWGAITARCLHTRCAWGWKDFRARYEPIREAPVRITATRNAAVPHAQTNATGSERNGFKVGDRIRALDRDNFGIIMSFTPFGANVYFKSEKGDTAVVPLSFEELRPAHGGATPIPGLPAEPAEPYVLFPIQLLPRVVRKFVVHAARSIGCDPAYVAVPLLAVLGSAIGNSRRIRLKHGWTEPSVIWAAVVGESGTLKSPALEVVLRWLREIQAMLFAEYAEAKEAYEKEKLRYEGELAEWKKKKGFRSDPPEKPEEPICPRLIISNATVEAVAEVLDGNPRGVLLARDELGAWLASFGEYKAGRGGDVQAWLEAYRANEWLIDRKSGIKKTIRIPRAAVSVTGTVQPGPLQRSLGLEHFENGLASRFLFCMPPPRVARWSEAVIDPDVEEYLKQVINELFKLRPETDMNEESVPVDVELSVAGKEAFVRFHDEWAEESEDLTGPLAAAWSKLKGYTARLALIFHLVRHASGETPDGGMVDESDVEAAAGVIRWFGREARRVYSRLAESDETRPERELLDLIHRKGGRITPRDLARATRRFHGEGEEAEQALEALVKHGHGAWEDVPAGPAGGRPTRVFVVKTQGGVDETPEIHGEDEGLGYVDTQCEGEIAGPQVGEDTSKSILKDTVDETPVPLTEHPDAPAAAQDPDAEVEWTG